MRLSQLGKSAAFLALTVVLGHSGNVIAADYSGQARIGIGFSDNIGRSAGQEVDGTIATAGFDFGVNQQTRRLNLNLSSSFNYLDYQDATYEAEWVGGFRGNANVMLIEERLRWVFQDNFGQQLSDAFQPARPNNRENVNYFSTGPTISLLPASRTSIKLDARFGRVDYEERIADNDRLTGTLSLGRELSQDSSASLNVEATRVEYDEELIAPPYESHAAFMRYTTRGARSTVGIDVGLRELEYGGIESEGLLLKLDWSRKMSANGTMSVSAGTRYSDQGENFRYSQVESPQFGDTADITNSVAPFQRNHFRIGYGLERVRYSVTSSVSWNQEDYKGGLGSDRDSYSGDLRLRRELSPKVFAGAVVRLDRREYKYEDRRDDDLKLGFNVGYRFGSGFDVTLDYEYFQRNSITPGADFTENRAFVRLAYTPRWSRQDNN